MSKLPRTPPKSLGISKLINSQSVSDSDLHLNAENDIITRGKRPRVSSDYENSGDIYSIFKDEIKDMITSLIQSQNLRIDNLEKHLIHTVREENTNTMKTIEKNLDMISSQITSLQQNISTLEEQRQQTMLQVVNIEKKLENVERYTRKTNIEIRNIPLGTKDSKDVLYQRIQSLLQACDLTIPNNEIRDVYVTLSKNKKTSTVIAELPNTLLKNRLLNILREKYKNGIKLDTSLLGFNGPATPIYISENLTPFTRKLYSLARSFCNTNKYKYCWIKNGRIYVRREENQPAIPVIDENSLIDLNKQM